MDSDSEPSSSEEELREMLRKDQNIDEKNIGLLTKQSSLSKKNLNINYTTENLFSRIFFSWSKRAKEISNQRILKTSDLCALQKYQSTRYKTLNADASQPSSLNDGAIASILSASSTS